ncbi:MAG: hypothetical protein HYU66_23275 [Armatimonadetes bacterium]|nr:hypothetical protein [Armatimonadota bacterium]
MKPEPTSGQWLFYWSDETDEHCGLVNFWALGVSPQAYQATLETVAQTLYGDQVDLSKVPAAADQMRGVPVFDLGAISGFAATAKMWSGDYGSSHKLNSHEISALQDCRFNFEVSRGIGRDGAAVVHGALGDCAIRTPREAGRCEHNSHAGIELGAIPANKNASGEVVCEGALQGGKLDTAE